MTRAVSNPPSVALASIETPALLLDASRLRANIARMNASCAALGVKLRPHLKTSKSLHVAELACGAAHGPITVSTLKEAGYFAEGGYRDILYAVTITAPKLPHVRRIQDETGARIIVLVDSAEAAKMLVECWPAAASPIACLVEVDCGEHRSGAPLQGDALLAIARIFDAASNVEFLGVMTHAGHSYSSDDPEMVRDIAETERRSAVDAAEIIRAAGIPVGVVSIGSTPTVLLAEHLRGVTEVRCGIYMVWDLAQVSRRMCTLEDIAVSVLSTVIGHNRQTPSVIIDAGALALSKDIGANKFLPDAKFGYVCDMAMHRLGALSVDVVHQEHGTVHVPDASWLERLPIGSLVRIMPNHACLTCAAYDRYHVLAGDGAVEVWPKINGW